MSDPQKVPRVFVVDDEHNIAFTISTILRNRGFDATPFTEPLLALSAARAGIPDLLLSDIMMPLLNGIELAIKIRAQYPNCKILLFSGQPDVSQLLSEAMTQGHVFEVLPKPMHPSELLSRIQSEIGTGPPPAAAMN